MPKPMSAYGSLIVFLGLASLLPEVTWGAGQQPAEPKPASAAKADFPDELLTIAEKSEFRSTSSSADVVWLVQRLNDIGEHVHSFVWGRTFERRALMGAIVANPPVQSVEQLREDPRLKVLVFGNIHSGECAGKEAILMMLRELTLSPQHPWLKDLVIVFAPNYSADSNERRGKQHRPGQVGPVDGMGRRENPQGLDLNRDFIKLESPEARALVQLLDQWNFHMVIDCHTTNGSQHRYQLTYDVPHHPASPPALRDFLRNRMMPQVTSQLESQGTSTFYYGNFNRDHTTWTTYGYEPRYSTDYVGMRGRLGILSEAYSYISFKDRILATRSFVGACLSYVSEHADDVRQLLDEIEQDSRLFKPVPLPLEARLKPFPERVQVKGFRENQPMDHEVAFWGDYEASRTRPRAWAYVLPFEMSRVVDRIRMHGVEIEQLTEPVTLQVEGLEVTEREQAENAFQGHRMISAKVATRTESRTLTEGSYVIQTSQPLGTLAAYLLEPDSTDSLMTWNFLDEYAKPGRQLPYVRVPAPVELKTRQVDTIVPAERLTLDKIFGPDEAVPFAGTPLPKPKWLPNQNRYRDTSGRSPQLVDAATGAVELDNRLRGLAAALAQREEISPAQARELSRGTLIDRPDLEAVIVEHDNDLYSYHLGDRTLKRLTHNEQKEQLVTFSPNGERVAFVRESNLFLIDLATGDEVQLTRDGSEKLFNGILDWVYQEELYGRGNFQGFWWSPDSKRIAFLQLDESPVDSFTVTDSIPYKQSLEVWSYPKAGAPLPKVKLAIVDVESRVLTWAQLETETVDPLISHVSWKPDSSRVVIQWQNREQTWLDLIAIAPDSGAAEVLFRETTGAWVNVLGAPHWLDSGEFLWLSERSGNRHIYRYAPDGKSVSPVTQGAWDVQSIEHVDGKGHVYFLATRERPAAANPYRISSQGTHLKRLTPFEGHHSVTFSGTGDYFFAEVSSLEQPPQLYLFDTEGEFVRALSPNLVDHLPYYAIRAPESLQVPARDGYALDAMVIKPPNFDPLKKYPVLIFTYSGPQAPVIRDRWGGTRYLWHQMLAQRGYCVWMCDNRSASFRGARGAWPVHRKLGSNELRDIEDGVSWLKQQPWVDAERIGIWGWSYGGYITSYALTHSKSFRMGIAGAPVTDWHNYDAIYTERYMGLPQDNPEGYRSSSVVLAASQLHGRLLLIHGENDENVHIGNTLQLAQALQEAGKQFELMIYPKNRHAIVVPAQKRHLYELMTQFIEKNL